MAKEKPNKFGSLRGMRNGEPRSPKRIRGNFDALCKSGDARYEDVDDRELRSRRRQREMDHLDWLEGRVGQEEDEKEAA